MMNDENKFEFVFFDTVPEFFYKSVLKDCKYYIVTSRTRNYLKYLQGLKQVLKNGKYDVLWYNVCTLSDITLLKLAASIKYHVELLIVIIVKYGRKISRSITLAT